MAAVIADIILVLHVAYAAFLVGGFLVLLLGLGLHWEWVRARSFRLPHLVGTTIVAVEALIGLLCPLTWLENVFLGAAGAAGYERSFVGHLLYRLLYYDAPAWAFTIVYVAFALAVLTLFVHVPPRRKPRGQGL